MLNGVNGMSDMGRYSREVAVERCGSSRDTNADTEKRRCSATAWQAGDEVRGRTARSGLFLVISGAQFIMRGPRVHHERTSNKPDCKENRDHPGERREVGARGV